MTYIILLNWNNWQDTIECLESVLKMNCSQPFKVIVCDNASTDDSIERIIDWAEGLLCATAERRSMEPWSKPAIEKPIQYEIQAKPTLQHTDSHLTILPTGGNLGFAGGCNKGIKLAMQTPECQHVWLLNNDTVVEPDALEALLQEMKAHPNMGLCGSLLYFYHNPTALQAAGGRYQPWLGTSRHMTLMEYDKHSPDYIVGASMLASRAFIETVGLMDESYFLYGEEHDWAERGKKHFDLGIAKKSIVFHKEGASTKGGSRFGYQQSPLADFYGMRNRLRFSRKHFPHHYPIVWLTTLLPIVKRLLHGEFASAWRVVTLMWNPDQDYQPR